MIKDFLVFAPTQVSMCCKIPQTELKIREVVLREHLYIKQCFFFPADKAGSATRSSAEAL